MPTNSNSQKTHNTIEHVPSHIVPPRKKLAKGDNAKNPSSLSVTSHRSNKNKQKKQIRRYEDVKQEMLALNYDPSRDVL